MRGERAGGEEARPSFKGLRGRAEKGSEGRGLRGQIEPWGGAEREV